MRARVSFLVLAGVLALAPSAGAQAGPRRLPEPALGVSFLVGHPTGDFSRFVGTGYGAEFFGRYPLEPQGLVSLRADLGFLIYGYESSRVCFDGIGCRVEGRLQTSNGIFFGGIGPELSLPLDRVRPYVNTILGFGYFSTTSSLESLWGVENDLVTENLGDGTFSWAIGGGVEMNVKAGRTPIDLNLGLRYHENGVVKYLREGDIVDNPDGSITLFPIVSEANLISFRIGLTVGIPRGGDPQPETPAGWQD